MTNDLAFQLDTRLQADTVLLATWPLCDLLLMNDQQYPWCILVPRVSGVTELFHLSRSQRQQLDLESTFLSTTLMSVFDGEKLNVAALGNVVSQLHIHHVVRFSSDISWPAPIWGQHPVSNYSKDMLQQRLNELSCLVQPDWADIAASQC